MKGVIFRGGPWKRSRRRAAALGRPRGCVWRGGPWEGACCTDIFVYNYSSLHTMSRTEGVICDHGGGGSCHNPLKSPCTETLSTIAERLLTPLRRRCPT